MRSMVAIVPLYTANVRANLVGGIPRGITIPRGVVRNIYLWNGIARKYD